MQRKLDFLEEKGVTVLVTVLELVIQKVYEENSIIF